MIEIKTYSKPKKAGGSGGSSSSTKYISGVISEAEHAGRADKAKRAEVADQANYAGTAASAQNAAYASEAGNLREDAEILQQYLSLEATKDPQVVKGQVKFEQLLQLLQGFSLGNLYGFDGNGNGIINRIVSDGFNSASQQGFGINPDDNGRYSLSITDLIVWGKAVFNELEIRKLSYAGGNVYLSGAGSKLVKVVPVVYNRETGECTASTDEECNGWKCYILADDGTTATQNWWMVNDQARCQTFNIKPGAYDNASNKEYWRCVDAVSSESEFIVNDGGDSLYGDKKFDWVILSKTNCLTNSDIPAEGDAIVLDGHQIQTGDEGSISRTNILMLETTGADTPRIVGYRGITDFTHEDKDVFVISPSNVTISSSVFKFKTVSGQTITIINDRGAYDPAVGYYYYDRVIYDNAYWTLIYNGDEQPVKGITPTEEAVNDIVYWRKDLSGGIKGDDAVSYSIQFSIVNNTVNGVTSQRLYVTFTKSVGSNITSGTIGKIGFNGRAKVYLDGEENGVMSSLLIQDYPYIDIGNKGLADMINGKKNLSVELIDANGKVVASNIFFFAEKGDDAVNYSVSLMKELRVIAGHSNQSAVTVSFRKQEGSKSTVSGNISVFGDSASVKCYVDGEYSDNMTDWINSGSDYFGYLNYEDAWTGKSVITVVMYIGGNIVASANFSLGQSGEGVVMAYKNATYRPEPPVTENLSLLTNGWSLMPQKGGSYEKVSNVSYGDYTVGDTKSGYSTSEWSEVADGGYTWQKSPAGLSDSRGWALMKVSFTTNVDNADVKVVIKAYSEANFDFIQVHELDKEITGSISLRKTGVIYTSGNGVEGTYNFTSVGAGQHFFYVSYCKDTSGNSNGDYGLFRLDLSDNLVSLPSTVWMSQATLKDGKAVLPWSTPIQITGDDAYRVEVSPSTLVFDTNENGVVDGSVLSGKYATVTVYKGSQKISADNLSLPSNYATKKYTNVEGKISNVNGEARITINKIEQETISGDEKVSKSSGQISFPIDVLGERSTLMWVTVNVQVNVSKFTGTVAFDNKRYKLQFDELSNGGGAATKNELNQATSNFEQTARKISLSVSEKSVGRRNLLVGSACRKYGDGFMYMSGGYYDGYPLEQIEKNSGIDGVNCIHCRTKQAGTTDYYLSGFRWHGVSPQGNIKLEKGKNYVLSFYAKTHTPNDIYFMAEVLYQGSKIDTSRPAGYAGPTGYSTTFSASEADKWELFTVKVSVPPDAPYEYVEINIFARARSYSFVSGYICKPMLEEGENYNGWTLSEQDYDYVGGNLLDNARTLDKSGTLVAINDTVIQNGYGTDSACIKNLIKANATASDYKEVLKWIFGSTYLVNGNDYIFSFVAKADVDDARVVCYMWSGDMENSCDIFTEGNGGTWDSRSDGNVVFILSRQWTRYWVHWRPKDGYATPKEVIIRHTGNNSTSTSTVYVTQPKLEIGATMTEWTERKTDLVDKASLKAAGIEITSDQVILYGNKVQVKNPKANPSEGYDEAAMFQNGKLNAQFINAGEVVAEGIKTQKLEAQNLNVTGNSRLGIFQIKTSGADERDQYTIAGDMITYIGDYKLPDGTTTITSDDGLAYLMYKPLFIRQGAPDMGKYMRLGNYYTEWDDCGTGNGDSYLFNGASARYVCSGSGNCKSYALPTNLSYNTGYSPVSYIYATKATPNDPAFAINVVETKGSSDGTRTAIQTNGAIRGVLAPNVEIMQWGGTIQYGVGVVLCTNNDTRTLTLPENPVEGQTLIIIQKGTGRVYLNPGKKTIYCGTSSANNFYSGTTGQFTILVYANSAWQLQWMNYRP